jgi:serine/threonine protein kinase
MARKSVVHKDLKPENILLNSRSPGNYDIRIADFGFATIVASNSQLIKIDPADEMLVCGTPGFIAPETLRGKGYSLKSDVFSTGSIMYNLLTKKTLFYDVDHNKIIRKNYNCDIHATLEADLVSCTKFARDLCMQLLLADPYKRPFAVTALRHPWFTD